MKKSKGKLVRWMDENLYPQYQDRWDELLFRQKVLSYLGSNKKFLDIGAGRGRLKETNFKGLVKRAYGIDIENEVLENPNLDEAKVAGGENIPYEPNSFDLIIADNVMEHIGDPAKVFKEVARTLTPGGIFVFKTPNRYHYVAFFARLTPISFHKWFNKIRGRDAIDTFPTLYLANTESTIQRYAEAAKLKLVEINIIEGRCEYGRVSALTYLLGFLYEKFVNSSALFRKFRAVIICVMQK